MTIDVRLRTLATIEETKSFTKAAAMLNLTQPAVSAHIRSLEKELGVTLVIRSPNSVKLTEEGQIAVHYAHRLEAINARMLQKIIDAKDHRYSLTIGVTHTVQNSVIIEAIARYASANPGTKINFVTGNIKELYEQLDEYEIDLAIVEGKNSDPSFDSVLLDTDAILVAMSPKNPLASNSILTLDELRKQKIILRSKGSATRSLVDATLQSKGIRLSEFDVIVESQSLGIIKDLVKSNNGVAFMARSSCLAEERKKQLTLLPVVGLSMVREINLVFQRSENLSPILNSIVSLYNDIKKEEADY